MNIHTCIQNVATLFIINITGIMWTNLNVSIYIITYRALLVDMISKKIYIKSVAVREHTRVFV